MVLKMGGSGFYGNQHGKNEELTNNFTAPQKTEKDIADMMGISRQQLQNYKKLTEMIPELEELVDTGIKRKATGGRSVPVAFSEFIVEIRLNQFVFYNLRH